MRSHHLDPASIPGVCLCETSGGLSTTGTGSSFNPSVPLSVSFHRLSVFTHISSGGWTKGPLASAETVSPRGNYNKNLKRNSGLKWRTSRLRVKRITASPPRLPLLRMFIDESIKIRDTSQHCTSGHPQGEKEIHCDQYSCTLHNRCKFINKLTTVGMRK
jgi:hypothetical protein